MVREEARKSAGEPWKVVETKKPSGCLFPLLPTADYTHRIIVLITDIQSSRQHIRTDAEPPGPRRPDYRVWKCLTRLNVAASYRRPPPPPLPHCTLVYFLGDAPFNQRLQLNSGSLLNTASSIRFHLDLIYNADGMELAAPRAAMWLPTAFSSRTLARFGSGFCSWQSAPAISGENHKLVLKRP